MYLIEGPELMANKVLVNKIIPFSNVDGMGNRLSIFLQGCNLNCIYCHNSETINNCNHCMACVEVCPTKAIKNIQNKVVYNENLCVACDQCIHICPNNSSPKTKWYTVEELLAIIHLYKHYIKGITISGGEATLQKEFLVQLFQKVKPLGLTCYIDTNGYFNKEACIQLIQLTDQFLFDIKTLGDAALVGKQVDFSIPIFNLNYLLKLNKIEEVRTVVIKNSDVKKTVEYVAKILSSYNHVHYKLIKVHKIGVKEKNRKEISNRMPEEDLITELVDLARKRGFNGVIDII
jgi:pyruvate formate lyase activating enzyme